MRSTAEALIEEPILDSLMGGPANAPSRDAFRVLLRNGGLDEQEVEVEVEVDVPIQADKGGGAAGGGIFTLGGNEGNNPNIAAE